MVGVVSVASAVGCYKGVRSKTPPILGDQLRGEYEHIWYTGRDANTRGKTADILEYARAVGDASGSVRVNINSEELQEHVASASALLERVLPQLDDTQKPAALRSKALLLTYGTDWTPAVALLRESMDMKPDFKTGMTLLSVMRRCWPEQGNICSRFFSKAVPPETGVEACTKTYRAGKAEKVERGEIVDLLALCAQFAPSDEALPTTFPSVRFEDWTALRVVSQRAIESRAARNRGPCLVYGNGWSHCTQITDGRCVGWGDPCE